MKTLLVVFFSLGCAALLPAQIYFLDAGGKTLSRVDMDGSNRVDLVAGLGGVPYGLAYDPSDGKLYWSSSNTSRYIQRANLDGTGLETLYSFTGGGEFGAIAPAPLLLDTKSGYIYFNDIANDKLWQADINGGGASQISEILDFGNIYGSNEAYGLTAHNATSLTYTISMSGADEGAYNLIPPNPPVSIQSTPDPGAILADLASDKYFYTAFLDGKIFSMDFDGNNNVEILTDREFEQGGGGLAVYGGQLYWTEQGTNAGENGIWIAGIDGSNPTKLYTNVNGATGYMYGIVVVPEPSHLALLGIALLGLLVVFRPGVRVVR